MEFVRWYIWPVTVGFILSFYLNPLVAGVGFLVWLGLIAYALKRLVESPEH